jgi:hypothetical protein
VNRRVLIGATLVGAAVVYLGGRVLFSRSPLTSAPTPLARVGFALRAKHLSPSNSEWDALGRDVIAVHGGLNGQQRDVFDMIVSLRGLGSSGTADWDRAELICRRVLQWPRCDRAALDELSRSARPTEADADNLESVPAAAVANAVWAFGSGDAVRKMAESELARLPESDSLRRARVFVRFGIIDTNPDGQAALFAQACVADVGTCEHLKEAAQHEVQARFVAPGNVLPLYFGGHPPMPRP